MELIELHLLAESGISAKSLYAYTHSGFGCIVRTFQAKGLSRVTPTMLDEFLLEQFELFGQRKFSPWKWRLVCRSCELLKYCAVEDLVDMPPLHPPQNNLQIQKTFLRLCGKQTGQWWNWASQMQLFGIIGKKGWPSF